MIRPWPSLRSQLPVLSWPSKPWGASLLSIRTSKWQPARRPGLLVKRIAVQAFVGLEMMLFRMVFHVKGPFFSRMAPKSYGWSSMSNLTQTGGNSHDFGYTARLGVLHFQCSHQNMKKTGGNQILDVMERAGSKNNTVHLWWSCFSMQQSRQVLA